MPDAQFVAGFDFANIYESSEIYFNSYTFTKYV